MKKNTKKALILLTFFCATFGNAYSNIPNASIIGADNSLNKVEDNLISGGKSENTLSLHPKENLQDNIYTKKKYKAKITVGMGKKTTKVVGYLYAVNDSSIVVSPSLESMTNQDTALLNITIARANIRAINLKKKGHTWRGYIIGTAIGIGVGVIAGVAVSEGEPFFGVAGGGIFGILGSLIGTPIGAASGKYYQINGRAEYFLSLQPELKAMSWVDE